MKTILRVMGKLMTLAIFMNLTPAAVHAQWTTDFNLTPSALSAATNENMTANIAVNKDTVNVVWTDKRTTGTGVFFKRSTDAGLTWSVPKAITDTSGSASFSAIACSGNILHVVWMDGRLGQNASFYKRSLNGGVTWSSDYCLDSNTKFWPGVSAAGSLVVVSLNEDISGNTEVFFRRSADNGSNWSAKVQISNATGRSEDPCIATGSGYVHLVWNDNRTGVMQTFYRRSTDAGQTWGPETQLTNTTGFAYCPMISLYDSNVDFVWADRRPTTFNVYYKNSHDFGANWSMERQMSNGTANALYPVVARNKDYIHMIWYLSNSDVIYHQSKNNGLTWLADTGIVKAVNKPGSSYILSSGRVLHMIWIDRRNTQPKVYYKRNPTANLADTLAILTTDSVTAINNYSAVSGGNITNDGGSAVTMRGVVWDISTNPTVALLTKTNDGAGTGYFISSLTGLNLNTIYYVRAYAITNVGTSYGNERTFKTLATGIDESSIKNITVYSYDKNIIIRYNPETGNNPIISIYNLFGQELINITRDSKETVINMSLYPQGYYLVKIVAADKITLQKIFIK